MPLGLVHVQDLLDLYVQRPVELGQALRDILVHCRFADAEFLRGGADSGPVLYNVLGQALCPLLHVTLQNTTLPASSCSILCGAPQGYVPSCRRKSGTEKIQEIFGWFSQWTNSGVSAKIDAVRFSRCPGENFANVIFATMQTYILCARMVKHHNICNIKIQICIQAVYRRDEEKVHERYQTEQHGSKF